LEKLQLQCVGELKGVLLIVFVQSDSNQTYLFLCWHTGLQLFSKIYPGVLVGWGGQKPCPRYDKYFSLQQNSLWV